MADKPLNIYQKLIEVRKTVPYLQKENSGKQYNYVGSSQVLAKVSEKMNELGLMVLPEITDHSLQSNSTKSGTLSFMTELTLKYTIVNSENPEEKLVFPFYAQGVDLAGEKGVGKALTYGEKYFFLKLFNIATDKDDPDHFQQKSEGIPQNSQGYRSQAPQGTRSNVSDIKSHTASGKQIGLIKGLWKGSGGDSQKLDPWVKGKYKKPLDKLTTREASGLIEMLQKRQNKKAEPKHAIEDPFANDGKPIEINDEDMPF
jgi:hypothetical protein